MSPAYCCLSVKITRVKRSTAREDSGHICFVGFFFFFFACVVSKSPKNPNLSAMADVANTSGDIRGLGSPLYTRLSVDVGLQTVQKCHQKCHQNDIVLVLEFKF